ncbi:MULTISPECIES: hypothetical protein [unclassified Pseudomonas]|uniref:hypothetical protein n=1 Tax=unclassified Pseudomonas TaxID=196821 RepID=UPI000C88A3D2|nr:MULTISPECIES: hypothetical protein [unclassified Pseudomonas]PMZ89153.1 hypothetical protein C1X61_11495 [Pseudomonas sp. FW215-T2]PNA11857.1 hypothetical protein C1X62_14415 [Pseudomonas sp. FW215-R3]PNB37613.1 hypothetical protein C1X63_11635 [Pseudomonas sp. FW305-131]
MKKSRLQSQQSSTSQGQPDTEPPSKIVRILAVLRSGISLNRFEAERIGDHCLPSTISELGRCHGLIIDRHFERVPNRFGDPCLVKRYNLPSSEHDKTDKVLAYLKHKTRVTTEGESND